MTIEDRRTGWLTREFQWRFREILAHSLGRYQIACPTYCLMPDHLHALWMGLNETSDQRLAMRFFREHVNRLLANLNSSRVAEFARIPLQVKPRFKLQKQAYDHVLRPAEYERGALARVAHYIMENPVRAQLLADWKEWEFSGGMIAGYPELDPRQGDYWKRFWTIYEKLMK